LKGRLERKKASDVGRLTLISAHHAQPNERQRPFNFFEPPGTAPKNFKPRLVNDRKPYHLIRKSYQVGLASYYFIRKSYQSLINEVFQTGFFGRCAIWLTKIDASFRVSGEGVRVISKQ